MCKCRCNHDSIHPTRHSSHTPRCVQRISTHKQPSTCGRGPLQGLSMGGTLRRCLQQRFLQGPDRPLVLGNPPSIPTFKPVLLLLLLGKTPAPVPWHPRTAILAKTIRPPRVHPPRQLVPPTCHQSLPTPPLSPPPPSLNKPGPPHKPGPPSKQGPAAGRRCCATWHWHLRSMEMWCCAQHSTAC